MVAVLFSAPASAAQEAFSAYHVETVEGPRDIAQSPRYTTVLRQTVPAGDYVLQGKLVVIDSEGADDFPASARCTLFSGGEVVDTYALSMGPPGSGTGSDYFELLGTTSTTGEATQVRLACRKGSNDTTSVRVAGNPKLSAIRTGAEAFEQRRSIGPDDIAPSPNYTTILTRSAPAGSYLVKSKALLADAEGADSFPASARCTLFSGGSVIDTYALSMDEPGSGSGSEVFTLQGVAELQRPTPLSLKCRKGSNDTTQVRVAANPVLVALRVEDGPLHADRASGPDDISRSPDYTTILTRSVGAGRYAVSGKLVVADPEGADDFPASARCTLFTGGEVVDTYALSMGKPGSGNGSKPFSLQGIANAERDTAISVKCRKGSNDTTRVRIAGNPRLTAIPLSLYPDPPPVFPVLQKPHAELLSPVGGRTNRPILVLYVQFADDTYEESNAPPGQKWNGVAHMDAGNIAERVFGGFPSVADYYSEVSNNHMLLSPAAETDSSNAGAANDGVVSITVDANKDEWVFGEGSLEWAEQQQALLNLADRHVDFSDFDSDGDARVTEKELIILRHDVDTQQIPGGSGGNRNAPAGLTLDGVTLGSPGVGFSVVNSGTATNLMTLVHELGHAAYDMPDSYFQDVGTRMDIGGFTSNVQDRQLFRPNAWHALHLTWAESTAVTESGYYEVPRDPAGRSFILYDPYKGTDDYFIVENRARIGDTYDQGLGSTGLVVWRIDESVYARTSDTDFMTLVSGSAFSSSNVHGGPQRSMKGVDWRDGTPSGLAIRAIPSADDTMRVYFDIRGPGVLVDPVTHRSSGGTIVEVVEDVSPGVAAEIVVPAMNTGEENGDFRIFFDDLPDGWDGNPDSRRIGVGERVDARPTVQPAPDAVPGAIAVTIVAESVNDPAVRSQASLRLNVLDN